MRFIVIIVRKTPMHYWYAIYSNFIVIPDLRWEKNNFSNLLIMWILQETGVILLWKKGEGWKPIETYRIN